MLREISKKFLTISGFFSVSSLYLLSFCHPPNSSTPDVIIAADPTGAPYLDSGELHAAGTRHAGVLGLLDVPPAVWTLHPAGGSAAMGARAREGQGAVGEEVGMGVEAREQMGKAGGGEEKGGEGQEDEPT